MRKLIFMLAILLIAVGTGFARGGQPINVATYNLRYNNPGDGLNAWPNRKEHVKALIRYHEFDIFGTQEGLIGQLNDLAELQEYAFIGAGRDDGKQAGEHSAIFYRKDRFQLLDNGDFWLSETPEQPSKGWDATCCNRICSWAKFRDMELKKDFYFFSVHFDHQGVQARRESGKLMVEKIQVIAGNAPVICVGDFNSTPETEQIQTMKILLNDSRDIQFQCPYEKQDRLYFCE
jgi:endonuclease/exonuclease/phosphatase family metal-dependent hydrolase